MLVKFDEDLSREFYLTTEESNSLNENGFVYIESEEICIIKDEIGEIHLFKETDDYTSIQLYSRLADEEEKENA